jgi:hypothetical protein
LPGHDHGQDAGDELSGFARAGRGLDDQRRVEVGADAGAGPLVGDLKRLRSLP